MTSQALYLAVGWIIVTAFAVTLGITLAALIGKVKVSPGYLKALFAKLILEVVAAALFIFYHEPKMCMERFVADYNTLVPSSIVQYASASVADGGDASIRVDCPSGWTPLDGGLGPTPPYAPFDVKGSSRDKNGWLVHVHNHAGEQYRVQLATVQVTCERPKLTPSC